MYAHMNLLSFDFERQISKGNAAYFPTLARWEMILNANTQILLPKKKDVNLFSNPFSVDVEGVKCNMYPKKIEIPTSTQKDKVWCPKCFSHVN